MDASRDLDDPCGRHFRFRDLICCGPTWERVAAELRDPEFNRPQQPETWEAIARLCRDVLDPLVDAFGPVTLTYGFASRALTRHIGRDIAPQLDQHAGHELNRAGKPVCPRLGMAVDVLVPGRDSVAVARWIARHTPFDRLYVYGPDRPLHVSAGPDGSRTVVEMTRSASGRRHPKSTSQAIVWLSADKAT